MRALVVADSRFVAEMIQRSLRTDATIHVIGYVDGRKSCLDGIAAAQPDVVVFDEMTQPGLALTRLREARAAGSEAKLVVLTARMQDDWLAEVVEAGAHAVICKSLHPRSMGMLVRAVCSGSVYHAFAQSPRREEPAPTHGALTRREHEILRLVAGGASNAAIASRLSVTEQTVKFHLSNVYRKLGVVNRTQASRYAHVHRLVAAPTAPATPHAVPTAA